MKYFILSVYDRAAAAYGRPVFSLSKGAAVRSFQDEVNRPAEDNVMYKHPKDYDLYYLGMFDDQTGVFEDLCCEMIARGAQLEMPLKAVS